MIESWGSGIKRQPSPSKPSRAPCGYAPHLAVSVDTLFAGVPFEAETPRRLTWPEFAKVHQTIERLAGSDERLLALGPTVLNVDAVRRLSKACALVLSPRAYYLRPPI